MTGPDTGPLIPRRRLGAAFRDLREARGETLQQTAAAVLFSPSKLSRIENGIAGEPHPRDVRDLLAHFAVDGPERAGLEALAEAARRPGWWRVPPYDMPGRLDTYISYENAAARIDAYVSTVVPGPLQTPGYAYSVLRRSLPHLSASEIELQVRLRMDRRRKLEDRAVPLHQRYVVPETILHRVVGSRAVMYDQLDVVLELTRNTSTELYVVPFSAGIYEAVELPAVTIFTFPDPSDPPVVSIEGIRRMDFSERPQTIVKYRKILDQLKDYRLDRDQSSAFIERIRQEKWTEE